MFFQIQVWTGVNTAIYVFSQVDKSIRRPEMPKKIKKTALGKGLKALIKDRGEEDARSKKELDGERHARNMEFYGSLMKKYVRSGVDDQLIDQMMSDIRSHMGISRAEHENLLTTLRKRESLNPPKEVEKQKAEDEIKEELTQIYDKIHKGKKKRKSRFSKMERELKKKEKNESIQLTNGDSRDQPKVKKVIRRRLTARNLDERAGIVNGSKMVRKSRLEWLDGDDGEAIMMKAPQKGLEDSKDAIKAKAPQEGLDEDKEPIKAIAPRKGMDEEDKVIISGPREEVEEKKEESKERKSDLNILDEKGPSKPLEMPPASPPEEEGPGFEMVGYQDLKTQVDEIEELEGEEEEELKPQNEEAVEVPEKEIEELTGEDQSIEEEEKADDLKEPQAPAEDRISDEEPPDIIQEEEEETEVTEDRFKDIEDSLLSLKMLMEEEQLEAAAAMADRLLEKDPDDISVLNEAGVILYKLGKIDEALDLYSDILEKDPGSVETLINYATLLSMKGNLDDSLECLDRAVKRDPYSEDAWNNKAVVLTRAGRLREALECLDEALRINEKIPSTWMNAGIILEKMGEIGPAMECYQNLLEMEPNNELAIEGIQYCRSLLEQ